MFFNYGDTPSLISGEISLMYNNPNMSVTLGIGLMIVMSIVFYTVAHFVFKKKDILI